MAKNYTMNQGNTNQETNILERIHELAKQPAKVGIDEVAHAYISSLRVEGWETLCEEFGGHKIGAIYLFVLDLIQKHISDSLDAREMAKKALVISTPKGAEQWKN